MTALQRQIEDINRDRLAGASHTASEAEIEERFRASTKLFVYGTLRPGAPNHHVLAGVGGTWSEAAVCGDLSDDGWAANRGYPAITLNRDGDSVPGMLLVSPKLAEHWTRLDDFEGDEYCRSLTRVHLADGAEDVANVYALRVPDHGAIDGGKAR